MEGMNLHYCIVIVLRHLDSTKSKPRTLNLYFNKYVCYFGSFKHIVIIKEVRCFEGNQGDLREIILNYTGHDSNFNIWKSFLSLFCIYTSFRNFVLSAVVIHST